jgi:murein DD-endopeptidase MepM/ murein hydrolase activator NlpD
VPRHRRRPGLSRYLLLAALGAIALTGIGSIVAGTILPATPAGAVEGVSGVPGDRLALDPAAAMAIPAARQVEPAGPVDEPASPAPDAASLDVGRQAASTLPAAATELGGYQWPLPHGRITLPFGPTRWGSRVVDGEPFHDGLDLATFCGDRIVAAHDGVVMTAGRRYDTVMGWVGDLQPYLDRLEVKGLWSTLPIVVVIDDGNGYRSIYAHFSKVVVKKGQTVKAGQFLGYEGMTGRASGCHLHYGLFSPLESDTFAIDPDVAKRMKLPEQEIARVDPLLVLPARAIDQPSPSSTRCRGLEAWNGPLATDQRRRPENVRRRPGIQHKARSAAPSGSAAPRRS